MVTLISNKAGALRKNICLIKGQEFLGKQLTVASQDSYTITQSMFTSDESSCFYDGGGPILSMERISGGKLVIRVLTDKPVCFDCSLAEKNVAIIGGADLKIKQDSVIAENLYIQSNKVNISGKLLCKNLSIDSARISLSNDVKITSSTHIKSEGISLGSKGTSVQQLFLGDTSIEASTLYVMNNSNVCFHGVHKVDNSLSSHTTIAGSVSIGENCQFSARDLIMHSDEFYLGEKSSCIFDHCYLQYEEVCADASNEIQFNNNTMLHCSSEAYFEDITSLTVNRSVIISDDVSVISERVCINDSKVISKDANYDSVGFTAHGSEFLSDLTLKFKSKSELKNCKLMSKSISISQDSQVIDTEINAEALNACDGPVKFVNSVLDVDDLSFESIEGVILSNSNVCFLSLRVKGLSKWCDDTSITSVSTSSLCSIHGELVVNDANFQSFGYFSLSEESSLTGSDFCIRAQTIINKSKTSLESSFFFSDILIDSNAESTYSGISAEASKAVIAGHAQFNSRSVVRADSLYCQAGAQLSTHDSRVEAKLISCSRGSIFNLASSKAYGRDFLNSGESYLKKSRVCVEQYFLNNKLDMKENSFIACSNEFWVTTGSKAALTKSNLASEFLSSDGKIHLDSSSIAVAKDSWFLSNSEVNVLKFARIKSGNLHLEGKFQLEKHPESEANSDPEQQKKGGKKKEQVSPATTLVLEADDFIKHYSGSSITGPGSLKEKARKIKNHGKIHLDSLVMTGVMLINIRGKIAAKQMMLGFDAFVFSMLGQIYADNLAIQSNYMTLLNHTSAKKRLFITGIFSLQLLSLTTANRNSNNTLINLVASLSLPNVKDVKSLFHPMSIICLVQSALATFVAPAVPAVGIALGVTGAAMSCYGMYHAIRQFNLNMKNREKGKLHPYELYSLIGIAAQLVKAGFIVSNFTDSAAWEAAAQPVTDDAFSNMMGNMDYGTLVQSAGAMFGSSEVNSLFSLDAGINGNLVQGQTDIVSLNFGLNAAGFGQYSRAVYLVNGGANFASTQSYRAVYLDNIGRIQNALHFSISADQFMNTGLMNMRNGNIHANGVDVSGQLSTNNVSIAAGNITLEGSIDYQNHLVIRSDNFTESMGAILRGEVTQVDGEVMQLDAQTSESNNPQPPEVMQVDDTSESSSFQATHVLDLEISGETNINGVVDGGDSTQLMTGHLNLAQDSSVVLQNTRIQADSINMLGDDSISNASIIADELNLGSNSSVALQDAVIQAESTNISGHDTVTNTSITGHDLAINSTAAVGIDHTEINVDTIQNDGQANLNTTSLEGDTFVNNGTANFEGHNAIEVTHVTNTVDGVIHGEATEDGVDHEGMWRTEAENTLYVESDDFTSNGRLDGFDATSFQDQRIDLGANSETHLNDAIFHADDTIQLEEGAQASFENLDMEATVIDDGSDTQVTGEAYYSADSYTHKGHLEGAEGSHIYIEARDADLEGSANADNLAVDTEDNAVSEALVYGEGVGANYNAQGRLDVHLHEDFVMDHETQRNEGLGIVADSVDIRADINVEGDVLLQSTEGNVQVEGNLNASNVAVDSGADVNINSHIEAEQDILLRAEGDVNNFAGEVTAGNDLSVSGNSVNNYGVNANNVPDDALTMGDSGVMHADHDLIAEARDGNIDNEAGVISADHYLQGTATGDIIANAGSHTENWTYGAVTVPDAASFLGGSGRDEDGVGLFLHALGSVLLTASNITSAGRNYISGDQGIDIKAFVLTYISYQHRKSSWFGLHHKWTTTISQKVYGSSVTSLTGDNTLVSENGEVTTEAAQMVSKDGNNIYAHGKVGLYDLVTNSRTIISKETLGFSSGSDVSNEIVNPTLVYDEGDSTIHSDMSDVDVSGAVIIGPGKLHFETPNGTTIFGRSVLDHSQSSTSWSINISVPVLDAIKNLVETQSPWSALQTLDPRLSGSSYSDLANSSNGYEYAANALNTLVDAYNSLAQVSGLLTGPSNLGDSLASYGTVHISLSRTHTTQTYQTLASEGVNREGDITIMAQHVQLNNGAQVHSDSNIDIDAEDVSATGARLESTFHQDHESVGVSISPTGEFESADASYSQVNASQTQWVNAELSADGNIHLHHGDGAMEEVNLDAANIDSNSIDADINHLNITDEQDTSHSSSFSASASTTGSVSVSESSSSSAMVGQTSGIHTHESINTDEHEFHVGDAQMRGGQITSDSINAAEIDHLETQQIHDYSRSDSAGISGNVKDFAHHDQSTGVASADNHAPQGNQNSTLPTSTVSFGRDRYDATRTSVIGGSEGTDLSIGSQAGELSESVDSGIHVDRDSHTHLHVDVPVATAEQYEQSFANIRHVGASVIGLFSGGERSEPTQALDHAPTPAPAPMHHEAVIPEERQGGENDETGEDSVSGEDLVEQQDSDQASENPSTLDPRVLGVDPNDFLPEGMLDISDNVDSPIFLSADSANGSLALGLGVETAGTAISSQFEGFAETEVRYGSGEGVGRVLSAHGRVLGFVLSFTANAIMNPEESPGEDALRTAESEAGVYAIERAVGAFGEAMGEELAGPVGWVFLALGAADAFTYNHERNDEWLNDADQRFDQSAQEFQEGDYVRGIEDVAIATGENAVANLSEAVHEVAELPEDLGNLAYQAGSFLYNHASAGISSIAHSIHGLFSTSRTSPRDDSTHPSIG